MTDDGPVDTADTGSSTDERQAARPEGGPPNERTRSEVVRKALRAFRDDERASLSRTTTREQIDTLVARVEELEAELKETREHAALERAQTRRMLASTEEDIREDLSDQRAELAKEDAKLARRLSATEDRLDIDASAAFATADGGHDATHLTPLQRLIRHGQEGAVERPTATHRRAREIALNFGRWGEKLDDKLGKRIRLSARKHAVKSRLEDVTDESLQWNQIHRAMAKVADLSDGRVELLEDSGGKTEGKVLQARYGEIDGVSGE